MSEDNYDDDMFECPNCNTLLQLVELEKHSTECKGKKLEGDTLDEKSDNEIKCQYCQKQIKVSKKSEHMKSDCVCYICEFCLEPYPNEFKKEHAECCDKNKNKKVSEKKEKEPEKESEKKPEKKLDKIPEKKEEKFEEKSFEKELELIKINPENQKIIDELKKQMEVKVEISEMDKRLSDFNKLSSDFLLSTVYGIMVNDNKISSPDLNNNEFVKVFKSKFFTSLYEFLSLYYKYNNKDPIIRTHSIELGIIDLLLDKLEEVTKETKRVWHDDYKEIENKEDEKLKALTLLKKKSEEMPQFVKKKGIGYGGGQSYPSYGYEQQDDGSAKKNARDPKLDKLKNDEKILTDILQCLSGFLEIDL